MLRYRVKTVMPTTKHEASLTTNPSRVKYIGSVGFCSEEKTILTFLHHGNGRSITQRCTPESHR